MDSQGKSFVDALLSQSKGSIKLKIFARYEREEVMKTVCAYLNHEGGWLVIGLEKDGTLTHVDSRPVLVDIQQNAVKDITPLPLVYVHEESVVADCLISNAISSALGATMVFFCSI